MNFTNYFTRSPGRQELVSLIIFSVSIIFPCVFDGLPPHVDGYHETATRDPVGNHLVRKRHTSLWWHLALPHLDPNLSRPRTIKEELLNSSVVNDSVSFVLLRWFEPHELCTSRHEDCLPICPPPLNINHCLWKHAESETDRRSITFRGNPTPALRHQLNLFGSTTLQPSQGKITCSRHFVTLVM